MNSKNLTYEDAKLLQRRHDGEAAAGELDTARALLERSEPSRVWAQALDEVQLATRGAAQEIEANVAQWPDAGLIATAASEAAPLATLPLSELIPLLDRFHDGEADEAELEAVAAMLEEREDVASYLEGLDEVGVGVKAASQDVSAAFDSGAFWSRLESRLDEDEAPANNVIELAPRRASTAERPMFSAENHQVMIYRHYDGEASPEERAQVAAWSEIDPKVAQTLAAMEELTLATRVAVERAQDRVDLSQLWGGVQAGLERELSERESGVVSLERAREAKAERKGLWRDHQREIVAAAVAALVTIIGLGMFGDKLFKSETVVVRERTVVIVDSVESSAGSSVMVSGPMAAPGAAVGEEQEGDAASQEAEPTIIWLFDESDKGEKPDGRSPI
jgi:hypothetical protein